MGRIPEEDVQRVRDATDLVALVAETVVLKQKGRLFWGNCPFHGEKTPSFKIDPATQLWHCFGCNRGGDAFGFVMEAEHLDFPDAVRRLAERARIEVREEGGAGLPAGRKERLIAASEAAAEFFHRELVTSRDPGAVEARAYLAKRGFGSDVAKRWRLGYASSRRDALSRALLSSGFTRDELVEANLALADGGSLKDRFFGRIMFPIADLSGKVIAFGGRVVGAGEPKYLNSQETPIFRKSSTLYGLDRARSDIVVAETAVVVEGYTDVIALHEAGIRTAVATLGTALTQQHVRLLGRFGKRVVYLFDGDEAGRRAAMRAVEFVDWMATPEAGRARVDLAVALIGGGMDPADYVSAEGADAMRCVIEEAAPLLQFVIDTRLERHDLTRPEGRSAALTDASAVLAPVRDSLLGKDYMNYLAGRLQTEFATVQRAVPKAPGAGRGGPRANAGASGGTDRAGAGGDRGGKVVSAPLDREAKADWELVRIAALAPQVRERARDLLTSGAVVDEDAARVLGMILEAGSATEGDLFSAVAAEDREAGQVVSGLLMDGRGVEQVEYAFREVSTRIKEFALGRLILDKKAALRALDPARDREAYDRLFGEIAEAQRQQQELRALRNSSVDQETESSE